MNLPIELSWVLSECSEQLSKQADGRLLLPHRKKIWAALGPRLVENGRASASPGLARRTRLAILCEQFVMPIWIKTFPDNDGPRRMVELAETYVPGRTDFRTAWSKPNAFWSEVDSLAGDSAQFPAVYAGYAASRTAFTAIMDENFDPRNLTDPTTEDQLDAESWDAAYWASLSHGGGAPGEKNSSPQRRAEFWRWYLEQAVPAAFQAAP